MNNFMMTLSKNKPSILMGLGIGSMITAILTGIRYSPMARDALDAKKEELNTDELDTIDIITTAGPFFIPTITFAITGIGCIGLGNKINLEGKAAALTACALTETTSQIYREKVRDIIGEKKEKTIHESAAKETYYRNLQKGNVVIASGNADGFPVYDDLTKQKIKSKIEKIHATINDLNRKMLSDGVITLDEYCLAMNEEPMEFGTELGWNIDRGFIELEPPTAIVSETGEPVIVIMHRIPPRNIR